MTDQWKSFYLKDTPFKEASHIQPESNDPRINGRIFDLELLREPFDELLDLIRLKSISYVRTDAIALGIGKSALMAANYWHVRDDQGEFKDYLPVWVSVHDYKSIIQLMSRVVETFVFTGIIGVIQKSLPSVNRDEIKKVLGRKKQQILGSELVALEDLLTTPDENVSWRYANIRRRHPISHVELFTDLCIMFGEADKRHILVYIDQFEEYMLNLRGSRMLQFGQDIKDLYRSMTESGNLRFVVSLHPNMELQFVGRASDILQSYGTIEENSVTVPPFSPENLIGIAQLYIKYYRLDGVPSRVGPNHPFDDEVMNFVAINAKNNPRIMIRILGNLLNEAVLAKRDRITMEFAKTPKVLKRTGLDTSAPEELA